MTIAIVFLGPTDALRWPPSPPANDDRQPPSPSDFCWFDYWGTVSDERQARAEEKWRMEGDY